MMKLNVLSGDELLETEEPDPECGQDFCDTCGDCLECYGEDPCLENENEEKDHLWVVYGNKILPEMD